MKEISQIGLENKQISEDGSFHQFDILKKSCVRSGFINYQ